MSAAQRSHHSAARPGFPEFAEAITKNDTPPSPAWEGTSTIYVGTAGDVAVIPFGAGTSGTPVVFKNMPAGSVVPVHACQVMSTNTTASNLVRIY